MSAKNLSFAVGHPTFCDSHLTSLAARSGILTAWQEAVAQDATIAARQVSGDFSVGLRLPDGRSFLAVDRFAIRSLCYCIKNSQIIFSEHLDDLTDSATEVDAQAIFDYLYFHVIPSPRTIYKGIFRLPPGHYAIFENGEITISSYWTPSFKEDNQASFDKLKEEFRSLLYDAVHVHFAESRPACFLSGGTDSSTVAGMAAQVCEQPISTYSIGFDAKGYDEMQFARLAARQLPHL